MSIEYTNPVSVEIKVAPGKEMLALDMAEALDAAMIYSGIVQGCTFTYENQRLAMDPGRIIIKGRIGVVTGGLIEDFPTLSAETDCKLLAVCDLRAETPFYIRFFTDAEIDALTTAAEQITDFNAGNGVAWVTLGTGRINPATQRITAWTPSAAGTTKNTDLTAYRALQTMVQGNQTSITELLNKWVTYIQRRLSSADYFITAEEIVVPACSLAAGESRYVTCPAVRGSVVTATAVDNRTESIPQIPSYNPTPVDGVPTLIDNASARYIAKAITGIMLSNSAFVPRNASQAVGKNSNYCVLRGFTITGSERGRKAYIWIRNTGTAEAIIDVHVNFMFVRRG